MPFLPTRFMAHKKELFMKNNASVYTSGHCEKWFKVSQRLLYDSQHSFVDLGSIPNIRGLLPNGAPENVVQYKSVADIASSVR